MLLLKSIILGFSVSAPVGPIGLLCIQRVLSRGKTAGILTGFGAVTANIIYASIAAFGFSVVSAFLIEQQALLRLIGSAFLFYLGVKTFFKKPASTAANLQGKSLVGMYLSTFLLMITNPVTILNFTAMFAGLGFDQSSDTGLTAVTLIGGVFFGAAIWWVSLSLIVSIFKNKITPHLGLVNKIAGLLIIALGILAFVK
ncbi:LysE family transporter [Bacillus sp. JJ1122]|uniref:LysE family translocator n=1 Tax=Bacillus sp. JJ1122 TaxID=3122951 RepID=UPI002FFDD7F6